MKRILPVMLLSLVLSTTAQVNFKARTPGGETAPPQAAGQSAEQKSDDTKATPKGPHSVALSCTPSTTTGVTGYNFYRGTAAGGEATTALNASPVPSCAYTDTTAAATTTYFYTAKAFCGSCNPQLSVASNEATAATPADAQPNPPTGLTVGTVTTQNVPLHWIVPTPQTNFRTIAYSIMRGTQPTLPGPATIYIVPGNLQSYTDTSCKGTCYYEVKAYVIANGKNYVYSGPSNIVKAVD